MKCSHANQGYARLCGPNLSPGKLQCLRKHRIYPGSVHIQGIHMTLKKYAEPILSYERMPTALPAPPLASPIPSWPRVLLPGPARVLK